MKPGKRSEGCLGSRRPDPLAAALPAQERSVAWRQHPVRHGEVVDRCACMQAAEMSEIVRPQSGWRARLLTYELQFAAGASAEKEV